MKHYERHSITHCTHTDKVDAARAYWLAKMRFELALNTGTAYQRAVEDLNKAGLNPMLACNNGGAASGGGAQAVMQDAVGAAVNSGFTAKMNAAQIENMKNQNEKLDADTEQSISADKLNTALISKAEADSLSATSNAAAARAAARNTDMDTYIKSLTLPGLYNQYRIDASDFGQSSAAYIRLGETISHFVPDLYMRLDLLEARYGLKYDPNQPRVPAGSPEGGQWTEMGAGVIQQQCLAVAD